MIEVIFLPFLLCRLCSLRGMKKTTISAARGRHLRMPAEQWPPDGVTIAAGLRFKANAEFNGE